MYSHLFSASSQKYHFAENKSAIDASSFPFCFHLLHLHPPYSGAKRLKLHNTSAIYEDSRVKGGQFLILHLIDLFAYTKESHSKLAQCQIFFVYLQIYTVTHLMTYTL